LTPFDLGEEFQVGCWKPVFNAAAPAEKVKEVFDEYRWHDKRRTAARRPAQVRVDYRSGSGLVDGSI